MRCAPSSRHRLFTIAFALMGSFAPTACGRQPADVQPPASAAPSGAAASEGTVPHGDHNPRHGGVVLMKGDLHYEVVLDRTGRSYRVYFTDAVREELPASVASDVALTIRRPGLPDEQVAMVIDDEGESWVGAGRPVENPAAATARVRFSIQRAPYWIDILFSGSPTTPPIQ